MKIIVIAVLVSVATSSWAQYGPRYIEKTLSSESESYSKSGYREMPLNRPSYMRDMPTGEMQRSYSSSSYLNWGSLTKSSSSSHYESATPTWDSTTGQPVLRIQTGEYKNRSEEHRATIPLDYYGIPYGATLGDKVSCEKPIPPIWKKLFGKNKKPKNQGSETVVEVVPPSTATNTVILVSTNECAKITVTSPK